MSLKKYLETIRIRLLGPPEDPKRSGFTLSSNAPESDFSPRPQPVETSITIDAERDGEPRHRRPPGGGWSWKNGAWTRPIKSVKKCGHYFDRDCDCDKADEAETEARRRRHGSRIVNNPFASEDNPFDDRHGRR